MPNAFNFSASPFDCLTPDQQRLVRDNVDVAYYPEGETVLDVGIAPTHLFVIIKGFVTQYEGDEVITTFGPDDTFDGRGLVAGKTSSRFVAQEEVVCYQLARQAVTELIADNATFGALLFSDLSNKLSALSQRQSQHELQSLTLSRVDEAFVRPAHFVDMDDDVFSVVQVLQAQRTKSVLVRDRSCSPERVGVFTASTLQRAILNGTPLDQQKVGELANFELISIRPSDQVGDALALLQRHRVHRLVVKDDHQILGVLEALDLFSFLSNHSHLITVQVEAAVDIEGLAQAATQITRMVTTLYRSGTRVSLIARLVQDLNARLFERAWQLIAPPDLVANSCLFVMGSEGRGEQLLKTDQDNGLILRDGYAPPDNLAEICQNFSLALRDFGYPECPGHIMVSHPMWRKTAHEFGQMVQKWLLMPDATSLMNLAIFLDAHAVCGDAHLLQHAQHMLQRLATDNDAMLARFAASIDAFGNSQGWWNRLLGLNDQQGLHLKKEGIFPLVHGVRSLALSEHLKETSTTARIEVLVAKGVITPALGADLTQSLHFLMGLKLKAGLTEMETQREVTGLVDVGKLSTLERDLLKDALGVVKHFKALLRSRFKLDSL
ncbi:MAG: cyclic nucleotide-binding domain-containing protein [Limnohabitans sp.]|nr:cyclic nucleotide-binding domain-containing protein [Limnohabitans sp.]